jgi:hypothetical protein
LDRFAPNALSRTLNCNNYPLNCEPKIKPSFLSDSNKITIKFRGVLLFGVSVAAWFRNQLRKLRKLS